MLSTLLAKPTARPALGARQPLRRKSVVVRADNKPLREFSEETGEVTSGGKPAADSGQKQEALYAEENYVPRDTMSPEMKEKLRREYLSLGGSPNTAMGGNYFLWIILGISFLAVLSWLTGAI